MGKQAMDYFNGFMLEYCLFIADGHGLLTRKDNEEISEVKSTTFEEYLIKNPEKRLGHSGFLDIK